MNTRTINRLLAEPTYHYPEWLHKALVNRAAKSVELGANLDGAKETAEQLWTARENHELDSAHLVGKAMLAAGPELYVEVQYLNAEVRSLFWNFANYSGLTVNLVASVTYTPIGGKAS